MILRSIALVAVGVAVAGASYVRLAPMEAEVWHVDPGAAERTGRPNDFLIAPGGDMDPVQSPLSPEALTTLLTEDLEAQPRTTQLAATPDEGIYTYVQRTRMMGYPDVINLRVQPTPEGSSLTLWSRSRYGQSDLGVNRARVEALLQRTGLTAGPIGDQ
ncbi:DUF1499 domain-containing protein [Jannaschia sp. 2305UL9-9]|uniref:DUF1499 domain-containing protein n=1 Tax=Jannaschia sp. 2305UL9-9 TaxID=3121638 RepID=UPI0035281901